MRSAQSRSTIWCTPLMLTLLLHAFCCFPYVHVCTAVVLLESPLQYWAREMNFIPSTLCEVSLKLQLPAQGPDAALVCPAAGRSALA